VATYAQGIRSPQHVATARARKSLSVPKPTREGFMCQASVPNEEADEERAGVSLH
jgi:hypothetical protein